MLNAPLVPVVILVETWPARQPGLMRHHLRAQAIRMAPLPVTRPLDRLDAVLRLILRFFPQPSHSA